jgi:hypothetical protein
MRSYPIAIGLALMALFLPPRLANAGVGPPQDGITVLARGPVHEAFAQPMETDPQPGALVPQQPPDPVPETPAEQKPVGDNVEWVPGYWAWDSDRNEFLWVSGFWRMPPPGRQWVPGYWVHVNGGWEWSPGFWADAGQEQLQYQEPPPASLDNGPTVPAPDENNVYTPGMWIYRDSRYVWRPGSWCAARPGRVWCPPRYSWTPAGFTFVDGYWDYPLEDRGLLCAPVAFTQPLWTTPGWSYQPSYAVNLAGLFASLFVRPAFRSYYFGDYYGSGYAGLGFQPWYAYGPRRYDPLFNYYRWLHRGDPSWYRGLQDLYRARLNGSLVMPPRTLVQQNTLIQNTTVLNNTTNIINNIASRNTTLVNMVTPINQIRQVQGGHLQLTPLSRAQLTEHRMAAGQVRDLAGRRSQVEKPGAPRAGGTPLPIFHPRPAPGNGRLPSLPESRPVRPMVPLSHTLEPGHPVRQAKPEPPRPHDRSPVRPTPNPRGQSRPVERVHPGTPPRPAPSGRLPAQHSAGSARLTPPRSQAPHPPAASHAAGPMRRPGPTSPRSVGTVAHAAPRTSPAPRPRASTPHRAAPANHGGDHGGNPAHKK